MTTSIEQRLLDALSDNPWIEPRELFIHAGVRPYSSYSILARMFERGQLVRRVVEGAYQYRVARPGEKPSIYDPNGAIDTYPLAQCFGGLTYLNQVKEHHGIAQ